MSPRWLLVPALMVAVTWRGPVEACSCASPRAALLSEGPTPLNGQLYLRLPAQSGGRVIVREAFGGTEVPTAMDVHPAGRAAVAVLRPTAGWEAGQRYELVYVDPARDHPKRVVFGSFTPQAKKDETAPKLARPKAAVLRDEVVMPGSSCESRERWIEVVGTRASDDGPVFYAVWIAPAGKKIGTKETPRWILPWQGDHLAVGAQSMCAWFRPTLPTKAGRYQLQLAAVDAAGNRSARHRLDFTVK